MINALLYIFIVVIWGTTWIAIAFQTGEVPVENSIFYRFIIAAFLMFLYLIISKRLQRISLRDHIFCLLQGACIFCFNFYFFYIASLSVESGLLSVIFAMATIFNVLNNRLWHKVSPSKNMVIGSLIGVLGITVLFYPDIVKAINDHSNSRILGVVLAVLGTYLFSTGNMLTVRHNKQGLSLSTTTAWAMLYGSLIMLVISWIYVGDFEFDSSPKYVWSLVYLTVFGTIVAFAIFFSLITRIGANQTAYATVLFPIVALSISTVYEGYSFTPMAILGLVLVIIGNVIVFYRPKSKTKAIPIV